MDLKEKFDAALDEGKRNESLFNMDDVNQIVGMDIDSAKVYVQNKLLTTKIKVTPSGQKKIQSMIRQSKSAVQLGQKISDLSLRIQAKASRQSIQATSNERFSEFLHEDITHKQLADLEKFADRILAKFDIDVEFTRHFIDRVNDDRNNPEIAINELQKLFKKVKNAKGENIKAREGMNAVLKDIQSDLNLPIVVEYKDGEFIVTVKTIMRKKNFHTSKTSPIIKYK